MTQILPSISFFLIALVIGGCGYDALSRFDERWDTAYYGNPEVTTKAMELVIKGGDEPAGIYFVAKDLDAQESYHLKVDGRVVAGPVSMRLRIDGGEPVYLNAPKKPSRVLIDGGSQLEVLIYGDQPFEYVVNSFALVLCGACFTDKDLRQKILRDTPGLSQHLKTNRMLALKDLVDWVANVSDLGSDPELVSANTLAAGPLSAAQIYTDILIPNRGGFWCGGKSLFFNKVVALFDYVSFTMNFGVEADGLNHVTSIIADRTLNGWKYYIVDPTYNVTFWRDNQQMYSISDLVGMHREGRISDGIELQGDISRMEHLIVASREEDPRCPIFISRSGGTAICKNPANTLDHTFNSPHSWRNLLEKNGFAAGIAGFFDLLEAGIFEVGPSANIEARDSFIRRVKSLGIKIKSL